MRKFLIIALITSLLWSCAKDAQDTFERSSFHGQGEDTKAMVESNDPILIPVPTLDDFYSSHEYGAWQGIDLLYNDINYFLHEWNPEVIVRNMTTNVTTNGRMARIRTFMMNYAIEIYADAPSTSYEVIVRYTNPLRPSQQLLTEPLIFTTNSTIAPPAPVVTAVRFELYSAYTPYNEFYNSMTKAIEYGFGRFRRVANPAEDYGNGYMAFYAIDKSFPEEPAEPWDYTDRHYRILYFHGAPTYKITYSPYYYF